MRMTWTRCSSFRGAQGYLSARRRANLEQSALALRRYSHASTPVMFSYFAGTTVIPFSIPPPPLITLQVVIFSLTSVDSMVPTIVTS